MATYMNPSHSSSYLENKPLTLLDFLYIHFANVDSENERLIQKLGWSGLEVVVPTRSPPSPPQTGLASLNTYQEACFTDWYC